MGTNFGLVHNERRNLSPFSPGFGAMKSTMAWISGARVKYWPAPRLGVLGVLFQQAFVGIALYVGTHRHELLRSAAYQHLSNLGNDIE